MRASDQLQRDVLDELEWEPSVRASDIGISVHEGVVTLTGRVDSFTERERAEHACKRVRGVRAVANDLEVVLPLSGKRDDTDIARAVLTALEWSTLVPHHKVKVTVRGGWVTLEGELPWKYQKDAAYRAVVTLNGVRGVINSIRVTSPPSRRDVKEKIQAALTRSAQLDAAGITVDTVDDKVILRGTVRTWAEREDAERAAWSAPGVSRVESHIAIEAPELALV
jgi:osmotically-inducible protein OsmY